MRKGRALQFFGGLTVVVIGYVAWCSREMYLPERMPDLSDVPEDALPLVLQEISNTGLRKPVKSDFKTFLYRLSNPFDPRFEQADVSMAAGQRIVGIRSDRADVVFLLSKESGRWVVMDPKDWGRNP